MGLHLILCLSRVFKGVVANHSMYHYQLHYIIKNIHHSVVFKTNLVHNVMSLSSLSAGIFKQIAVSFIQKHFKICKLNYFNLKVEKNSQTHQKIVCSYCETILCLTQLKDARIILNTLEGVFI